MNDTIFALSSGQPPAAIGVIRISGPAAFATVAELVGKLPPPRRASLRTLRRDGEALDRALVMLFPSPATATGEDLAELHLHGGRAVVRAVETALASFPGVRPAEAGEFTRRALTNGRIDLTEAEGLGDLLAAETESQRRVAARVAEGGVRRLIERWAQRTLQLSATVEALLDHADEDDVDPGVADSLVDGAHQIAAEIDRVLAAPPVERLHDGVRVVLAGPPNAGKSTLLNALASRDAAIVSPLAGTTRDRIEVPVVRNGIAYLLIDTAGLHDAPADMVEAIGIDRARGALADADIILWLDDDAPTVEAIDRMILIHARADEPARLAAPPDRLSIAAVDRTGIDALWERLERDAKAMLPPGDAIALNQRQRNLASAAASALRLVAHGGDLLIQAEELRRALRNFDRITGAADTEAMLDTLFGRFCIGK